MKVDAEPASPAPGALSRSLRTYQDVTGQGALTWALIALLNFATQALLFHEMVNTSAASRTPGEFGGFNAALAIASLLTVPALALPLALRLFFARAQSTGLDSLRASSVTLTETFAWAWAACCFVFLLLPVPLGLLPRITVEFLTLMNVLVAIGAVVSGTISADARQFRRWALLLIAAGMARLILGGWSTAYQPCAEAALAAYLLAGFVTLGPALRARDIAVADRLRACASALDANFLRFAAATISVLLGLFLFTNADRIVTLGWMNIAVSGTSLPSAPLRHLFDVYQGVGLLARALLWGTQPLLWLLYADRSKLDKTTPASLKFFWIYLGVLVLGALLLGSISRWPASPIFAITETFGPTFAAIMIPLGLLQGLGIFSLASRRYPECYLIGACGLLYAVVVGTLGSHPQTILAYMFGASMVSLMIILFVGVVRWGRRQP